jgi:hypothetical protein
LYDQHTNWLPNRNCNNFGLHGVVPASIAALTNVERLDFGNPGPDGTFNMLTGPLPTEFCKVGPSHL